MSLPQRLKTRVHWKQLQNCKTRASPSNPHQKYKIVASPSNPHQKCKTVASPSEPHQKCKTESHNKAGENLVSSTSQTDHVCDFKEEQALGKSEPIPHGSKCTDTNKSRVIHEQLRKIFFTLTRITLIARLFLKTT